MARRKKTEITSTTAPTTATELDWGGEDQEEPGVELSEDEDLFLRGLEIYAEYDPTEAAPTGDDDFDPAEAAKRLDEKIKLRKLEDGKPKSTKRDAKSSALGSGQKAVTMSDLEKLIEFSENRIEPEILGDLPISKDIHGNIINGPQTVTTQRAVFVLPSETFKDRLDSSGRFDPSVGAQEQEPEVDPDSTSDPRSENFIVCVSKNCPVKEGCLRYRLNNKREAVQLYYPEECATGNGGYIPLSDHPDFTAYDQVDPYNIWKKPNIKEE